MERVGGRKWYTDKPVDPIYTSSGLQPVRERGPRLVVQPVQWFIGAFNGRMSCLELRKVKTANNPQLPPASFVLVHQSQQFSSQTSELRCPQLLVILVLNFGKGKDITFDAIQLQLGVDLRLFVLLGDAAEFREDGRVLSSEGQC